jgi:glycosyltransferase involved in cell wall biosynthesis
LKLLFVTQRLDPADPVLGATSAKLAALAGRVDEVVVLASEAATDSLPSNCRVRSFRSSTRLGRGALFEAALAHELPGLRGGIVVAHMCPVYAVLAAPAARACSIPIVLWYAHWRRSLLLRLAERAATAIATVDRRSFPLTSRKVHAIGHGIDSSQFDCKPRAPAAELRALALGRYSPAKGLDVIVRAIAKTQARLTLHGPALTDEERRCRRELARLVDDLGVADRVHLGDAVPRVDVAALFGEADVLVNNMRAGAPDKVVYEAAASCLPALASNPVFDELLPPELRFRRDRADELAERLDAFAALNPEARTRLGRALRLKVEQRHTVGRWADGIMQAAGVA